MRLFVAAEPSATVRHAAAGIASTVRDALERDVERVFRWIPAENLHLTVWFLGEVQGAACAAVLDALKPRLDERGFRLHLSGLGTFPTSGSPRVLWMGVREGMEALSRLHDAVGARLAPLGFGPDSRPYSAHLTLARIKAPIQAQARRALREALGRLAADAGRSVVEDLTIFRSRTSPKGAIYEPLLRVPLS